MCEKKPDGALGDRHVPRAAGQVQLLPEDEQGHQPEPEDGRRDAEEDEPHRRPVAAVRRLTAESTPIETPRMIQIVAAPTISEQRARRAFA